MENKEEEKWQKKKVKGQVHQMGAQAIGETSSPDGWAGQQAIGEAE